MPLPSGIAIIGTAGRDKNHPMTRELWVAMHEDLHERVSPQDHLVSGGAAWSDHLAVHAFLQGWVAGLSLYLPAPLAATAFAGPARSSAAAANYYHEKFSRILGESTIAQIHEAIARGAQVSCEPSVPGYGGFFSRNLKVAKAARAIIAYTFGEGNEPADGGTRDTWDKFGSGARTHVSLLNLVAGLALKPDPVRLRPIGPARPIPTIAFPRKEKP